MNSRALKCFIEVYEKKSVAAAAREIYISPQGLSKIIRLLEYDLEADLFYRGTQGMEATEAGELLYARARHVCYLLDDIKKEIGILAGSKGALQVVVTYSSAAAVSFELLTGFTRLNPNVQLKIDEYPDEYAVSDLFQDEADVGIVLGHKGIPNCKYDLILPGQTVITVSKKHPLADRKEISIQDLRDMPLILKSTEPGRENPLAEACIKAGFTPDIQYSSGNLSATRKSCLYAHLATESVDFLERSYPDSEIVVLQIKEKIEQNIYFISRERDIQNRAVTQFQKYVRENIKR